MEAGLITLYGDNYNLIDFYNFLYYNIYRELRKEK